MPLHIAIEHSIWESYIKYFHPSIYVLQKNTKTPTLYCVQKEYTHRTGALMEYKPFLYHTIAYRGKASAFYKEK